MISTEDKRVLKELFPGKFREGVLLADHTSFGIGGPAAGYVSVQTPEELSRVRGTAHQRGIDTFILGGGTNLLVSDDGYDGLVIHVDIQGIDHLEHEGVIRVGAGVQSADLVEWAVTRGLGGLQFAAGLPGTVGGAIAGNAGCYGCSFGDRLEAATVVAHDGTLLHIDGSDWFEFTYRGSNLSKRGAVVATVSLAVTPGDKEALRQEADDHLETRATKHPPRTAKTAGSYFKNLPPASPGSRRTAAGRLLDQCGAKGMHVNDAAVFEKHANILVNNGSACARDVLDLADRLSHLVRERFDVTLEPEVRFIGKRP